MGALGEREDPSGGTMYNQFDRVRVETTWKARLAKENEARLTGPKSGFQMNLAQQSASGGFLRLKYSHNRLETVTEKELKQSPQARMSAEGMDPNGMEVLAIKHSMRKPQQKFDGPMTNAQEIGWLLWQPVRSNTLIPPKEPSQAAHSRSTGDLSSLMKQKSSSSSGHIPGTLVCSRRPRMKPYSQLSLTTPANDRVLARVQSAPSLPQDESHPDLSNINNARWRRPKNSSDVTQYAEAFYTSQGVSPFSTYAGKQ